MCQENSQSKIKYGDELFRYSAFGFNIESTLELPGLSALSDEHELQGLKWVRIEECGVIDSNQWQLEDNSWLKVSENKVLFCITGVGHFLTTNGNKILFTRTQGLTENTVLDKDVRVFILGSCFGALALQNHLLPLHGSVAVVDNTAIAFVGDSGAGKSTMLGSYMSSGYKMLTDDVCVLNFVNGIPIVYPAYPQCKYNEDSATLLGHSFESMQWINRFKSKKYLDVSEYFDTAERVLSRIVLLEASDKVSSIKIHEMEGIEKFETIYRNTYRQAFHAEQKSKKLIAQQVALCAQNCRVFKLVRPKAKMYSPDTLVKLVNDFCFS